MKKIISTISILLVLSLISIHVGASSTHNVINANDEDAIVKGHTCGVGKLISTNNDEPTDKTTTTIFVHGINGAPSTLQTIIDENKGYTYAFAYEDMKRSLTDSSRDLANEIETWMNNNQGQTLNIVAHSMGGSVVDGAMDILDRNGLLRDRTVNVRLITPTVGGMKTTPPLFLPRIKCIVSSFDLNPESDYQKNLKKSEWPKHVSRLEIILAIGDTIIDPQQIPEDKFQGPNIRYFISPGDHMRVLRAGESWRPTTLSDFRRVYRNAHPPRDFRSDTSNFDSCCNPPEQCTK